MQGKVLWKPSGMERQGGLFFLGSVWGRVEGLFESQGLLPCSLLVSPSRLDLPGLCAAAARGHHRKS